MFLYLGTCSCHNNSCLCRPQGLLVPKCGKIQIMIFKRLEMLVGQKICKTQEITSENLTMCSELKMLREEKISTYMLPSSASHTNSHKKSSTQSQYGEPRAKIYIRKGLLSTGSYIMEGDKLSCSFTKSRAIVTLI